MKDMFEEHKEKGPVIDEELARLDQYTHKTSGISLFIERVYTLNGLYITSAILQIFLGLSVVALSLTQSISPLWIATIMTVVGSICSMVGIYFLYHQFSQNGTFDSLLHRAIKRVINSQN